MMGVKDKGATVWVTKAQNPNRKLKYDWQVIEVGGARVCINTGTANKIVEEAIEAGKIAELSGYETMKREVKYGQNSRIDILLTDPSKLDCYVEIKNVTLARTPPLAEFPDSPTARGTKHLTELAAMAKQGRRAVMLYLVNRTDCDNFTLASDIDPDYAKEYAAARAAGVESYAYTVSITKNGIKLTGRIG